ncbi:MAG: bleomycin resistance protein [Acidobacteria bacterium]|nr:MAG: bleomycin resistance protein [Acidobacteriota bacterium]
MNSLRLILILLLASSLLAQTEAQRPRILGVAHVALYTSDLAKARIFYEDFLGFQEPFTLKRDDGSIRIAFFKVNDEQYVELFTDPAKEDGQLNHVAIYTDNAQQMRDYLAAHGIKVPATVPKGKTGNYNFTIQDPDGHKLEIVQYLSDSRTGKNQGKFVPATRISNRILHAGFLVRDLDASLKFYRDLLGFQEFWRGSSNGIQLSWVNMRVPDGEDYVEFMLYTGTPSAQDRGVKNHLSLEVPDIGKAVQDLEQRPARKLYTREIKTQVGKNRKRQANLFDPDGTRVELMEPKTVDGQPAPSSTAPPPK